MNHPAGIYKFYPFSEIGDPAAGTIEVRESFKDILEEPEVFETLFVLKVINIERAPCPFIRRGGRSVIVKELSALRSVTLLLAFL